MVPRSVIKRVSTIFLLIGPLTSLAISPWFNFDPINLIKIFILTCLTMSAIGLLIPYTKHFFKVVGSPTTAIIFLFVGSLISAFVFSQADKAQQFWGVFGRGTGVLSYLVLAIVFLLSNFLASTQYNKKVITALLITTSLMVSYCLIQILKLDPIGWSAFFPFGTLGNVNFLSGFLGVALVSVFILVLSKSVDVKWRFALGLLMFTGLFALYRSDSTQGLVALVVGVSTYLLIRAWSLNKYAFFASATTYLAGFVFLVAGLFDKGPFREFIFQFTVTFRADYMHAGIEMLLRNPLNGVGIDAYDDWYRSERGVISALRTSMNRTANSAHNITLDLGAGGGFPLLISYLALIGLVLFSIIKGLRLGLGKDTYFMAASMSWVAYQVQAAVSINQIGVGVWGWILGGLTVGSARFLRQSSDLAFNAKEKVTQKKVPNTPPPLAVISSVVTLAIGFLLAYPPLKTDADFLTATKSGSAPLVIDVSKRSSANAFILSRAATSANSAGLKNEAREIIAKLIERFPRNLYGQLAQYENFAQSDSERNSILERVREIDPYVALCYEPNFESTFLGIIQNLPTSQSYELARGWGLLNVNSMSNPGSFNWSQVPQNDLSAKIASLCFSS